MSELRNRLCYFNNAIKVSAREHVLVIQAFSAACCGTEAVRRLLLVSFQSDQRNDPLAGPSANTDEGRLAFTDSILEALRAHQPERRRAHTSD